jgi:thioredoxin 1
MVKILNTEEFKQIAFNYEIGEDWKLEDGKSVILNFFASWCAPCRNFAPILGQISEEFEDKINVYKVDADASPEIAAFFEVRSLPTTYFVSKNDGFYQMGLISLEQMREFVKTL